MIIVTRIRESAVRFHPIRDVGFEMHNSLAVPVDVDLPFRTNSGGLNAVKEPNPAIENTSGIFFSIWTTDRSMKKSCANYNIHALKLRELKGYSITSRDFACDFRSSFASLRSAWPNVSVDYGPLTLMEGWIKADPDHCESEMLGLMDAFQSLSPLIDRLLESRRR